MSIAANKTATVIATSSYRFDKESLRTGLSEYGRQFIAGTQYESAPINFTFGAQLFFGAEITLLNPLSSRLSIDHSNNTLINPIESIIVDTDNDGNLPELTIAFGLTQITQPQSRAASDPLPAAEENPTTGDSFYKYDQREKHWAPQIPKEDFNSAQININLGNGNIYTNQPPTLHSETNADTQTEKKLVFKPIPVIDSDQKKTLISESMTIAPSFSRSEYFFHLNSVRSNITKSTDENIGDTLFSETLTTLNAKYFSEVEFVIFGGDDNATLIGNVSDNTLIGGVGNDILIGDRGNDQLIGGSGADIFVFNINDGNDQIIDFALGDRIQFQGAAFMSQLELSDSETGQKIQFGHTTVDIVGVSGLVLGTDWIILSP